MVNPEKSSSARSTDGVPNGLGFRKLGCGLSRLLGPDWPWIAAVLLVGLLAAWPAMSQPGLLNTRGGGDSPFLLQRLHQLATALADGHFPARWMPDANYGYGYPFYHFYAPLSMYVAAAFRFLGFSFVRAIHLAQLAGFAVAGLGMFLLVRRWLGSRWGGLLAAVAYTVAPFHMVNVYVRGDSLAEFWAMAFYPLILLAADKLVEATIHDRTRIGGRLALFGLAYAALILSHNISALIFSPFLLLYFLVRLAWLATDRLAGSIWPIASGLLLAFALAAWFFVPALAEQDLAQLGPVTEGYFHYSNHFRGIDLVQGGLIFDYDPDGGVAFRMGLVQLGLAMAGAVTLLWRRKHTSIEKRSSLDTRHASFIILSGIIAAFMVTPLSRLLWDYLPLLSFAQFPWRFLSITSFFMAAMTGGLVFVASRSVARAAMAILGGLVLLAAGLLGLRTDYLILTDADVTAGRLAQYEWFTGNIGTTVSAEYLTPEASPRPWTSRWLNTGDRDAVIATAGELSAELVERESTRQTWRLVAGEGGASILFPTLYWPGWRATVDGREADLAAFPASGLMALDVTAGEHEIILELGRTPVRLGAEVVSLVAAILVAGWWAASRMRSPDRVPNDLRSAVLGLLVIAIPLLLFSVLWRDDPEKLPQGDLTWDFAQMGYLHHTPGGVAFSGGARLYEYGYSGEQLTAGDTLTVTLSLASSGAPSATLSLMAPVSARPVAEGMAAPPALAAQTAGIAGEAVVFSLAIPNSAPAGLYVPHLLIEGERPLMPSGATRGDLFLRPVRVVAGQEDEIDQFGNTSLNVRPAALAMRDESTLDGQFSWFSAEPLGSRYQVSWRLQNGDGLVLSQLDTQPGYGFQPTDGWPANETVNDWLALRLPAELTGPPPHSLVMILYDVTTGEQLSVRRVGEMVAADGRLTPRIMEPAFALPEGLAGTVVTFSSEDRPLIGLAGYSLGDLDPAQTSGTLELALFWQSLASDPSEFKRFVHLIDATGAAVTQVDGYPAGNSYPTSQWTTGEYVTDTVRLDLSVVPPGEYRLAMGFYRPVEGLPRLNAAGPDGPLPDGRFILPEIVRVP